MPFFLPNFQISSIKPDIFPSLCSLGASWSQARVHPKTPIFTSKWLLSLKSQRHHPPVRSWKPFVVALPNLAHGLDYGKKPILPLESAKKSHNNFLMKTSHLGHMADVKPPGLLPFLCTELWWVIMTFLPTRERLRASRVCRLWRSIVCSQLHFLDFTSLANDRISGSTLEAEKCKGMATHDHLELMLSFFRRDCPNVWALSLPAHITSSLHLTSLQDASNLSSLSLFCCKAVGDSEVSQLASPSSRLSQHLETLILCGTNITRAGLTVWYQL